MDTQNQNWRPLQRCMLFTGACILILVIWVSETWPASPDTGKMQELNRALADMGHTAQAILEKIVSASTLRHQLVRQSEELKAEIQAERRRNKVGTLSQALQISRIHYDLQLVQQLSAYIETLDRRLGHLQSILQALEFYKQRVRDDLLILKALQDVEISELDRQIRTALAEFTVSSGKPLIVASQLRPPRLETVWGDTLQGR